MGFSNFVLAKSGRSHSAPDLLLGGRGRAAKRKKRGVISIKKKRSSSVWLHVLCHFQAVNCTKRAAKQVLTFFFFFFGDHPFFLIF